MIKLLTVFGTRPEAVKMCPLVLELRKHKEIRCVICLTGQHRENLLALREAFALREIRVKPGACALGEIRILASDADVK